MWMRKRAARLLNVRHAWLRPFAIALKTWPAHDIDVIIKLSCQKQLGDSVGKPFGSLEVDGMTDAFGHYHRNMCSRGAGEYCAAISDYLMLWVDKRDIIFREQRKVSVRKLMLQLKNVLHRHGEGDFVHRETGSCAVSVYIIVW